MKGAQPRAPFTFLVHHRQNGRTIMPHISSPKTTPSRADRQHRDIRAMSVIVFGPFPATQAARVADTRDHVAARDRAAVVTTAIIQIVVSALRRRNAGDLAALASMRAEIAATLREEFAEVEQQVLNEIRLND